MERAENLARLLYVNEAFARDDKGEQNWLPVIEINADEDHFAATGRKATARAVVDFYILDRTNPTSIVWAVGLARENARSLRHLISTEMWVQINVFYGYVSLLRRKNLRLAELSRVCGRIREGCQAHAGIVEGTLYRDQGWCFYQIGKNIERADQVSRLLDISYRHVRRLAEEEGSSAQLSRWNALLRSAAGYQAYRRTRPRGFRAEDIVQFLIGDTRFPRSIGTCLAETRDLIGRLAADHGVPPGEDVKQCLDELKVLLHESSSLPGHLDGLHIWVDSLQLRLTSLSNALGHDFFAWGH